MSASSCGPKVVLIGSMGAGKTTVGGLVAEALGLSFRDTDQVIEERAGKPVSEIFVDDGEPHFRDLERTVVAESLDEFDGVLALGGGAAMDPQSQELLAGHCVVFLKVGLADAASRVGLGVSRPMLLGNVRGRIKQLLDERTPIYLAVARHTVETDGLDAAAVADQVLALVQDGSHD
ncbi:shikimate kinase [Marmoricola sp. OAE513]|uniref:shikimate kinase n=1 Tax=Marmoricola sp. OAE513 TaxID=2817894 RepID=UPI001D5C5DB8